MLDGSFRHEDFCGHKGIINAGDLQVMLFHLEHLPKKAIFLFSQ